MKIISGIIKKVLTDEQYRQLTNDEINIEDIKLSETVRKRINDKGDIVEYLPFRLSFREMDNYGNDKYIFNESTGEYKKSFKITPIIFAYGKEMRILLETEDFNPVKITVDEISDDKGTLYRALCIQNQLCGLKKNHEHLDDESADNINKLLEDDDLKDS